jgi:hypothetical protein
MAFSGQAWSEAQKLAEKKAFMAYFSARRFYVKSSH